MEIREMNRLLASLDEAVGSLEEAYIENEGEITEETARLEGEISSIRALLSTEGIDLLGGWLKAKEDKKKALKAEKDYITRQMAAIDDTIEYIKGRIYEVMTATGVDKVKGERGYSFTRAQSLRCDIRRDELNDAYLELAQVGARMNGLPDWIDVQLKTTTTELREGGDDARAFLDEAYTPTVKFIKPRAAKEDRQ